MNKTLVEAAVDGDMTALIDSMSSAGKKNPLSDMLAQAGGVYGWSALAAAVHKNHEEVISALLDAGANPNQQDEDGDNFPLHWAKQPAAAELLVNAGADLSVLNRVGLTPLEVAERETNEAVIAVLKVHLDPWSKALDRPRRQVEPSLRPLPRRDDVNVSVFLSCTPPIAWRVHVVRSCVLVSSYHPSPPRVGVGAADACNTGHRLTGGFGGSEAAVGASSISKASGRREARVAQSFSRLAMRESGGREVGGT